MKTFIDCRGKSLLNLKDYLSVQLFGPVFEINCEEWNLSGLQKDELETSIKSLFEEVKLGLRSYEEYPGGFYATQDNMAKVVHKLICYKLRAYYNCISRTESKKPLKTCRVLSMLSWTYKELVYCVINLSVLFRYYCRLISKNPHITSDLQRHTAAQPGIRQATQAGELPDSGSTWDEQLQDQDEANSPDKLVVLNDPVDGYREDNLDRFSISEHLPNHWGNSARRWLETLIAQGRAMAILWNKRPIQEFVLDFPTSGASSDKTTQWLDQPFLKYRLGEDLFENIATVAKHNDVKFNGTFPAELIITAKLSEMSKQPIRVGISRRPCYVSHKLLEQMPELKFQPPSTSGKVWTVDIPKTLPAKMIKVARDALIRSAVRSFKKYQYEIQIAVNEMQNHSNPRHITELDSSDTEASRALKKQERFEALRKTHRERRLLYRSSKGHFKD